MIKLIGKWLQDNFRWYRRMKGGRWACWMGFWEQPDEYGLLRFCRFRYFAGSMSGHKYKWYAMIWWDAPDKSISDVEIYDWPKDSPPSMHSLLAEISKLKMQCDAKQARIDELMLEFCPEEMTQEQIQEWARHQRPVSNKAFKMGE